MLGARRTDDHGVPDAVAPPPRHARFPLVDGLRAIAALTVVAVHAAVAGGALSGSLPGRLLAHLNLGVTIFFLISGFLLYRPFVAHRAGGAAAPAVRDYARRRVLRIYPAYWLVLTVLVLVPGLTGVVGGQWWQMYGLVHTLPDASGPTCVTAPNQCGLAQTWSLVVELTFYAVLPLYALAIARATRGLAVRSWVRVELVVLAALSAASVGLEFVVLDPPPTWFSLSVLGYVWWFALGMGAAVVSVGGSPLRRAPAPVRAVAARPGLLWLAALGVYVALSLWLPPSPFLFLHRQQLVAHLAMGAIAALLLAPAVLFADAGAAIRRILGHPVVAWLGLVSYGIFLWHYVVTVRLGPAGAGWSFAALLPATAAISIACAAVSYYVVERPCLRLKDRRLMDLVAAVRPASSMARRRARARGAREVL